MSLLLLLLALSPAQADRYWDLDKATATALMERMEPGTLLLTYCPGCEGAYHVIRVRSTQLQNSWQEKGTFQVLIQRDIIHSGTEPNPDDSTFTFADQSCGRTSSYFGMTPDEFLAESPREFLDFPYTYIRTKEGRFDWVGNGTRLGKGKERSITLRAEDEAVLQTCIAKADPPAPKSPACSVDAYVTDPDPHGLNVRSEPGGKNNIVTTITLNTMVHISESRNGWLYLDQADFELSSQETRTEFQPGWVYHKLIGVSPSGENFHRGLPTSLHSTADPTSAATGATQAHLLTVASCEGEWLEVFDDTGNRGWLKPELQCPNPVTTCP